MPRQVIADERTGIRPLKDETVLYGIFNGDVCALELENGCIIFSDDRPNYHTEDNREFAEVLEIEGISGEIIGYVEVFH